MNWHKLATKPKKRSLFQIYVDTLRVVKAGEYRPTRIMYEANLSWVPLHKILDNMLELGLVTRFEKKNRRFYFITEKGEDFLKAVDELKKILLPSRMCTNADIEILLLNPINGSEKRSYEKRETIKVKQVL